MTNCLFCDLQGLDVCTFCDGTGRIVTRIGMLIPGSIIILIGVLLIPTAFIVSRD